MVIYTLVLGTSACRMMLLRSQGLLERRHINFVLVSLMVALTAICALSNTFTYLYGRQCPWTVDLEKAINLLGAARTLLHTIIQAFIVFITLALAYGYDVLYADISNRILKLVFGLTIARFFLFQFERALSGFQALQTYLVAIEFCFSLVLLVILWGYCWVNSKFLLDVRARILR